MFQIIYENFFNDENEAIETGNIIYANLILQERNTLCIFLKVAISMITLMKEDKA